MSSRMPLARTAAICAAVLLLPAAASAHLIGAGAPHGEFFAGFAHPLSGFDHILAMGAVGLLAAHRTPSRVWLLPAAFVAAMILGFAIASAGIALPWIEFGIAGSIAALGLAIVFGERIPVWACVALIALCAVLHGHAHGTEAVSLANPFLYAGGFALATAALHGAGIGIGVLLKRTRLIEAAGYGLAVIGAVFVAAL